MRSYITRLLALVCALTLLSPSVQAASSHSDLQRQIDAICQECNAVGVSVAYVRGGAVEDTFAWGWATYPHDPMTADTNVRIASISKVLVGIAAHLSAQAGTLDLDAPIDYALGYYLARRSAADVVTPRSILTHTSSIIPNPAATGVFDGVIALLSSPDSFYPAISGSLKDWDYNNFAFYVLGLAIEKANGQTMDEILNPALCDPLDIDASFWAGDLRDQSHIATQYDKDHAAFLTVSRPRCTAKARRPTARCSRATITSAPGIWARSWPPWRRTAAMRDVKFWTPPSWRRWKPTRTGWCRIRTFYQCQPLRYREGPLAGSSCITTPAAPMASCAFSPMIPSADGVVVLTTGGPALGPGRPIRGLRRDRRCCCTTPLIKGRRGNP